MHAAFDILVLAIALLSLLWQFRVWKPQTIILVRHGESEGNVDQARHETIQDHLIALTEKGRRQAREAGERIKAILGSRMLGIYTSPFRRTRETAEGILAAIPEGQIAFRKEDLRLREVEWGHLRPLAETKRISDARDAYGSLYFRVPDGESPCDAFDRVSGVLDTIHRDWRKRRFPKVMLLVSHGTTLRVALMRFFHFSPEEFAQMRNPHNCEIFTMTLVPRHAGDWLMASLGLSRNGKYVLDHPYPTKHARP